MASLIDSTVLPGSAAALAAEEPRPATYMPSTQEAQELAEIEQKFDRWRTYRQPHEVQWFVNAAFVRGASNVTWNGALNRLESVDAPRHRVRLSINRIRPKMKARMSKFLKTRPIPTVVPASTDREDVLNARATNRVLEYIWRKGRLERKYAQALAWSGLCGKGFWWFGWEKSSPGRVQVVNPVLQTTEIAEVPLGDVYVENGSPFEVLVPEMGTAYIGDQPEVMRVRVMDVADIQKRYPDRGLFVKADTSGNEIFQQERKMSQLVAGQISGVSGFEEDSAGADEPQKAIVKELFTKPCGKFPSGRHLVTAGGVMLKRVEELPYSPEGEINPYPCVEFPDTLDVAQFWPATMCEQMIPLQKEYNHLRSRVAEHLRLAIHPKLLYPVQAGIPDSAWHSGPGEKIAYQAFPGMPDIKVVQPMNVATDAWRMFDLVRSEFDEVTNIWPAAQGSNQGANSGFQVNLLQEAADSVHSPDIRLHAMAFEEAAFKIRRIVKQGYTLERIVTVAGRNAEPEVIAFKGEMVDENADIVVHIDSAISHSPAVRTQQILELFNSGLFGDPKDPETKRRVLGMLDMPDMAGFEEMNRRDEDLARLENSEIRQGLPVEWPAFHHNHEIHYTIHTDELKSPEVKHWPQALREQLYRHLILHIRFIAPPRAIQLAQQLGFPDLVPIIQGDLAMQQQMAPQGPPPPQGSRPPQPPPGRPAGPQPVNPQAFRPPQQEPAPPQQPAMPMAA